MGYYYGQTIKEYREKKGMTQAMLAAHWHSENIGVSERYVQDIEAGKKRIKDISVLRRLGILLDIPLWKMGISEYDPFSQKFTSSGKDTMLQISLDTAEKLIDAVWQSRRILPLPETEQSVQTLTQQFSYLVTHYPPHTLAEKQFLRSYARVEELQGMICVERKQYPLALKKYYAMLETAKQLNEPAILALAYQNIGTELERANREKLAVEALEYARDLSFQVNKNIAAHIHAYLSRCYASNKEETRFRRAIDTARMLAEKRDSEKELCISKILAEQSYGYLDIGRPQETLYMKNEVNQQIEKANNVWLKAWIPLDWARAYMMLNEVEESVQEGRAFFHLSLALQSPHVLSRAFRFITSLEEAGYKDIADVQHFREELTEYAQKLPPDLAIATREDNYSLDDQE
jgi:transcriptional regulator with XRE-family HTH domain